MKPRELSPGFSHLLTAILCATFAGLAVAGCSDDGDDDGAAADADSDTDSDTDADSDTDTDADTGADTGSDSGTESGAADTDSGTGQSAEECILDNCMEEIGACMADPVCDGWMTCIQDCGDDTMVCPTFCGMYYPSSLSAEFTDCAVDAGCLAIDFGMFPVCEKPDGEYLDLSGMEGTWWLAAASDEEHLFDYDCQKFVFTQTSATELAVDFSVPLTDDSVEKICETAGTFVEQTDGSIEVIYDNYAAYHESWYILHKSEDALLAHLCFASEGDADARDYGTLVLTRGALDELESAQYDALDAAVLSCLGAGLDDLEQPATEGCVNE